MSVHTVQLDEAADFINGRAFKPSEWGLIGTPIIRIQNLTGTSEVFNYYDGLIDERVRVRKDDILISWSASLGVYRWKGEDAVLNQHIFKVRLNDGIDPDYFYYAATDAVQEMASRVHGSTMQHITKDRFDSIHIPLPDLPKQKRIAALLEQADRLRRTRRYALELSDSFLPAAFLEFFGDLRSNPQRFEVRELGEICDVRDGTHDSPKYHAQGVPLVTSKNLVNGFVDLSGAELISEDDYEKINKRSKVDRGDILMPMIGTIGNPVLVEQEPRFAIKNVALIKFIAGSPSPIYIREILRGTYFEYLISMNSRGGTQQFISLGDIRGFRIPIPPLALQQKFAALVERHERLRATQREALRQAEHLFQTLLHNAFNQELKGAA